MYYIEDLMIPDIQILKVTSDAQILKGHILKYAVMTRATFENLPTQLPAELELTSRWREKQGVIWLFGYVTEDVDAEDGEKCLCCCWAQIMIQPHEMIEKPFQDVDLYASDAKLDVSWSPEGIIGPTSVKVTWRQNGEVHSREASFSKNEEENND